VQALDVAFNQAKGLIGKKIQIAEQSVLDRKRRERDEIYAHWHHHAER